MLQLRDSGVSARRYSVKIMVRGPSWILVASWDVGTAVTPACQQQGDITVGYRRECLRLLPSIRSRTSYCAVSPSTGAFG